VVSRVIALGYGGFVYTTPHHPTPISVYNIIEQFQLSILLQGYDV